MIEWQGDELHLVGEFDVFHVNGLEEAIHTHQATGRDLVINLLRCRYVDSTILSVFIRAMKHYDDRLRMKVARGGPVARILEVAKLDRLLPIE